MKEKLGKIGNSFKTGVMIWIAAYILLYFFANYVNDISLYTMEILKLENVNIFIAQILISGFTYIVLEIGLIHFIDNTIKAIEEKNGKSLVENSIISIIVLTLLLHILYMIKQMNIINRNVLKLMMIIIVIKCIIFISLQPIYKYRYNKKLKEMVK